MARGWARSGAAAVALAALPGAPALAQGVPPQPCRAPAPAAGQTVTGPVLHVIDGRTLCVALGPTPDRWIPLRISPSVGALPLDRERLMAAAFSRFLICTVTGGGPVRTAACTVAGQPLEAVLAEPATIAQASSWR